MQEICPDATDMIKEEGGDILKMCFQCGTCTGTCPWNQVSTFLSRRLVHKAQLGVVDFGDDEVWKCLGCKLCVDVCPRGVEVPDIMRAMRRVIVEDGAGKIPDALRITGKNLSGTSNPLGEPPENRVEWAKNLDIKKFQPGTDLLYFGCCYQAYDPKTRSVAQSLVKILKKAGVDFGILGNEQNCCGESIRKAGHESVFQTLAKNNIQQFKQNGVKKALTTSPHCYYTFKKEYKDLGADFDVVHSTQLLSGLIKDGRIKFSKSLNKKVTFHDSCCLGRCLGDAAIYEEPRQILKSIPGVELVEMKDNRDKAICCGGGAGGIWQDTKKGERVTDLRVIQSVDTGAQILAVACPYCMLMFKDSVLSSNLEDKIEIKDITELVLEAIDS